MSGSVDLGSAHGQIILDGDGAQRGVSQAVAALRQLESFAASAGASFARFAANIAGVAVKAGGAVAAGMGVAVAAGVKGAADLEQSVANISSIKPDIDTSAVFRSLNEISTRVPQSATQLADSLYNIFSSVDATQAQALTLVEQFARGAIGAQTDAETFGTAILGTMNAFGLAVTDADHIADVFFNTINRGVVTGPELAASLGPVTQAAKAAGLSLDDLGGFIAGVTKEGGPAAQNINNLQNFLAKVTTKDAQKEINNLGVATVKADGSFRDIVDILGDLKPRLEGMTEAQRANALQAIFPDAQARQGALVLLSQLDFVRESIDQNRESAGSASRAFENMIGTFKSQAGLLRNTALADLRTFGAAFLPLGTTIVASLNNLLRQAGPQIEAFSAQLAALAGRGLQSLTSGIPAAIAAVRLLGVAIGSLAKAFRTGDFNAAFGAIVGGLAEAFGGNAAGAVALFASRALRGLQLVRDAVITVRQAAAGNWFGGQDEGIDAFVRSIGRFTQLARDAFITVRQVFDRQWIGSPEIQPVIRAIGEVATAARDLADKLRAAGAAFAAAFTPARVAILRQFAADLLAARTDVLVNGLRLLGAVLPPVIVGLGRLAGLAIDALGALQGTGREAEVLRAALLLLGGVLALNQFADFVAGARAAESAAAAFFRSVTRGPRLVVTTIRAVYEVIGDAAAFAANVARSGVVAVRRVVSVVFAGAQDAAIWAQLYAEQAVQTITRRVATIYEALPPAPSIPDIVVRAIPQIDTSGLGSTLKPLTVSVQPTISPNLNLGTLGTDLGVKLAQGIALGLGGAIATAIAGSGLVAAAGSAIGAALIAAAPALLVAAGVLAQVFFAAFMARTVAGLIAEAGGIGPYLANIFLDAIPFALGAAAGALANLGLSVVNFIIQGLLNGVPALLSAISSNFAQILVAIGTVLAPLPTLIITLLSQVGPALLAFAGQVIASVGGAFSQLGTIVSTTLGQLGAIAATAFQSIVGAVGSVAGQIVAAVQAAFAPVSQIIQSIIAGDWGGAVIAGLLLIINLFSTLPGQIAAILEGGFAQIVGIISSTLSAAAGAVGEAFAGIVSAVQSAGEQIVSATVTAFQTVLQTIASILSGIGSAIVQFLASYVSGFQSTFNGELPATVASGMAQLVAAIADGIGQTVALVAGLAGQIAGALGNLGGILFNAGAQAMAGLLAGIESAAGAVLSRVAGLASQIAGAFSAALQIRSPSRVMAGLGEHVAEGVAVGIAAATPEATKAATDLANSVYSTVKNGVEAINSLGTLRAPSAGIVAAFSESTRAIVAGLSAVAGSFSGDALEAVGKFSDAANKVFSSVKSGIDAMLALRSVVRPTGASIGVFVAGVTDIVLALVEAAAHFSREGLDGAVALADAGGKILALIAPAVEAFRVLPGIVQPTADQLGVFTAGIIDLCLSLIEAARHFQDEGLSGAVELADAAGKILALVRPAVEGMRLLGGIVQPTADQLGVFTAGIIDITLSMVEAARHFDSQGLVSATALGDAGGKIIALIKPAVEGFRILPGIMQPTASQLGVFTAGIIDITLSLVNAGKLFEASGLAGATQLADAGGKILALIAPAIAGFRQLGSVVAPSAAGIQTFAAGVAAITRAIVQVAATFQADALAAASGFADTASKVVGLIGSGIDAIAKLAGGDSVLAIDGGRLGTFAASLRLLVVTVGEMARTVATDLVAEAGAFADGAGKAVALLSGVDAFAKLADAQPISPAQIDAYVNAVVLTVQRVAEASRRIDAEAAKAAGQFAESGGKVTSLIGSAISALTIQTNVDKDGNARQASRVISAGEIDQIVAAAEYAIGRLVGVSKGFDKGALAQLSTFSDAAAKGLGALRGVLDAIQAPSKDAAPKEGAQTPLQAIDALIALFSEGLSRLGALVGVATQYRAAAQQVRSLMIEAGQAFTEALGGLALPQGATPAALALAAGGTYTVRQEVVHTWQGAVDFRFLGDNGTWIVSSLQADDPALTQVAGLVGGKFEQAIRARQGA